MPPRRPPVRTPKLRPAELRRYAEGPATAPTGVVFVTPGEAVRWFRGRHRPTPAECVPLVHLCNAYLLKQYVMMPSSNAYDAYRADMVAAATTARALRNKLDAICTKRSAVMPRHMREDISALMAQLEALGQAVAALRGNQPAEWGHLAVGWAPVVTAVLRAAGTPNPSPRSNGPVAKVLAAMVARVFGCPVEAEAVWQVLWRGHGRQLPALWRGHKRQLPSNSS